MMSCAICGKGSCTRAFHSIEEQEQFDDGILNIRNATPEEETLIAEITSLRQQLEAAQKINTVYRDALKEAEGMHTGYPESTGRAKSAARRALNITKD